MKIALVGWSGNNNQGDDRMFYCVKRFFSNHTIVQFKGWLEAIEGIDKLNSCDYVLIGGGGLITRGFNRYVDFFNQIDIPLGCIGISIESDSLNEDMQEGLELLKKRSDFIYVRDKGSKLLLDNNYKVILGPDISYLYPYPIVKNPVKSDTCALNLRNWFWWDFELFGNLHYKFSKIDNKYPWFKNIYPLKKWNPDKLVIKLKKEFRTIKPFPLYFGSYDKTDTYILTKYFRNTKNNFNLTQLSSSRYLIGMRLHSIIFACQQGIPFISLSYEPKNENFCKDMGLPKLSLKLKDYKKIPTKITFLKENYLHIRDRILQHREKSYKDAKYIFDKINLLIESSNQ